MQLFTNERNFRFREFINELLTIHTDNIQMLRYVRILLDWEIGSMIFHDGKNTERFLIKKDPKNGIEVFTDASGKHNRVTLKLTDAQRKSVQNIEKRYVEEKNRVNKGGKTPSLPGSPYDDPTPRPSPKAKEMDLLSLEKGCYQASNQKSIELHSTTFLDFNGEQFPQISPVNQQNNLLDLLAKSGKSVANTRRVFNRAEGTKGVFGWGSND